MLDVDISSSILCCVGCWSICTNSNSWLFQVHLFNHAQGKSFSILGTDVSKVICSVIPFLTGDLTLWLIVEQCLATSPDVSWARLWSHTQNSIFSIFLMIADWICYSLGGYMHLFFCLLAFVFCFLYHDFTLCSCPVGQFLLFHPRFVLVWFSCLVLWLFSLPCLKLSRCSQTSLTAVHMMSVRKQCGVYTTWHWALSAFRCVLEVLCPVRFLACCYKCFVDRISERKVLELLKSDFRSDYRMEHFPGKILRIYSHICNSERWGDNSRDSRLTHFIKLLKFVYIYLKYRFYIYDYFPVHGWVFCHMWFSYLLCSAITTSIDISVYLATHARVMCIYSIYFSFGSVYSLPESVLNIFI